MGAARGDANASGSNNPSNAVAKLSRIGRAFEAFRQSWQQAPVPRNTHDRMAMEHKAEQRRYQAETKKYESKRTVLHRRVRVGTTAAIAAGTVAVIDLVAAPAEALFWIGAPTAVVSGWFAALSSSKSKNLAPPAPQTAPPPPPRPLPAGLPGATESQNLHHVRIQLARLLPTIDGIQEQAADDLRATDYEAAPAMAMLVSRLATLSKVAADMPGTAAAETAHRSAGEVQRQLANGVRMYEELLNAALELLSAPDPSLTSSRLHHTANDLISYSEGLRTAATTYGYDTQVFESTQTTPLPHQP